MILFPNAKINIGLRVLRRRPDTYHDIHTVMVPVPWCDILEMVPASGGQGSFNMPGGDPLGIPPEKNLVLKGIRALEKFIGCELPPLDIYLKKEIPNGAGLGGGSADASFAIRGANEMFELGLSNEQMAAVAKTVGADCPFFIYNRPMLAEGIGEILTPVDIPGLHGLTLLIAKPQAEAVSTPSAYAGTTPRELLEGASLAASLAAPVAEWKNDALIYNDFEDSIFPIRPQVATLKQSISQGGALYTSMSGSGASVYGLFSDSTAAQATFDHLPHCERFLATLTL